MAEGETELLDQLAPKQFAGIGGGCHSASASHSRTQERLQKYTSSSPLHIANRLQPSKRLPPV